MLMDATQFLLRVLFDLVAIAFGLRFYMQWTRVPFYNPFAQFIVRVTDFAVRPARRLLPGWFGLDWASLVLFFLAQAILVLLSHALYGYPFLVAEAAVWPGFILLACVAALKLAVYVGMGLVLIAAVLSWVNPYAPQAAVLQALSRPMLDPLRRFVPTVGGIDLSPLAALIFMQLLLIAPLAALERYARGLIGLL